MTLAEGGSGQTFLPVLKEADLIDRLFLCLSFHHIQSARLSTRFAFQYLIKDYLLKQVDSTN